MLINRPLISCVMLTADRPHFLPAAVDAWRAQTWPNRELIIYDSGRVPAEVERSPGVHIFRGPAANIGEMRNRANNYARGRLIAHMDDDDYSAPERLEEQFDILATHDADIVGYRTIYFREEMPSGRPRYWLYDGEPEYAMGATMFYRRVTWENRPFTNVMIAEELEFIRAPKILKPPGQTDFSTRRKVITASGHNPIRMIARHHRLSTSKRAFFEHPGGSWKHVTTSISKACESLLNVSH